ncbi:MAG: hypothetical protein SWK76_09130 [Actinomycetota bacterium]|nr:hypothetical protein [Actinomycetota bacterium]
MVDPELCLGPSECEWNCCQYCYFGAIGEREGEAWVDSSLCYGCG